jgi:hypothetical protein
MWAEPTTDPSGSAESIGARPSVAQAPPAASERTPGPIEADFSNGQIVIVLARWVLIGTALAITFWSPSQYDLDRIKISLLVVLALAVGNFALHAQLLMGRAITAPIVYGASAVDLAVVTLMTWTFGGLGSSIFVFYYPALLGIALVFPLRVVTVFTVGLVVGYAMLLLPTAYRADDLQTLVARVVAMVAVAVIGYMYQRIEADRQAASGRTRPLTGATPSDF